MIIFYIIFVDFDFNIFIYLAFSETKPLWNTREIGDKMQYTKEANNISYASVSIKNMNWPGSICVAKNGEFMNIYIGNSVKYGGNIFYPFTPLVIENDPEGTEEHAEPNPDKEPEIIESDTDKDPEEDKMDD